MRVQDFRRNARQRGPAPNPIYQTTFNRAADSLDQQHHETKTGKGKKGRGRPGDRGRER